MRRRVQRVARHAGKRASKIQGLLDQISTNFLSEVEGSSAVLTRCIQVAIPYQLWNCSAQNEDRYANFADSPTIGYQTSIP